MVEHHRAFDGRFRSLHLFSGSVQQLELQLSAILCLKTFHEDLNGMRGLRCADTGWQQQAEDEHRSGHYWR